MRVEFNSLHWDNISPDMLAAHKRVMDHFGIPMNYHNQNVNHGKWLNHIMTSTTSDAVIIMEPDCIPLTRDAFADAVDYAERNDTFVGIAQVSNHIPPKCHIYAAPGFFVMTKSVYDRLGRPSFSETKRSDIGEELCYIAEKKGIRYRALFPTHFEKPSSRGIWPLASLGYYGIGTVFNNAIYHLYESRFAENIELFVERCDEVMSGTFSTAGFFPATTFSEEFP